MAPFARAEEALNGFDCRGFYAVVFEVGTEVYVFRLTELRQVDIRGRTDEVWTICRPSDGPFEIRHADLRAPTGSKRSHAERVKLENASRFFCLRNLC